MNLLTNAAARRIMASGAAAAAHNVPESKHCPLSFPRVHKHVVWVFGFVRLVPKLHELVSLAVVADPQRGVCRASVSWVWGQSVCGGHDAEAPRANLPRAQGSCGAKRFLSVLLLLLLLLLLLPLLLLALRLLFLLLLPAPNPPPPPRRIARLVLVL